MRRTASASSASPTRPSCTTASRSTRRCPGWKTDISKARKYEELPKAARDYVEFIEARVGCPIKYVSVGAERDALIIRD